jgi:hypothetical protein
VAAVVVVSAGARFAASLSFHAPWVAPDEMAYGLLGESLWETGRLTIRGTAAGYYSLVYPALAGGPLSLGGTASGIVALQAAQALAMSLVAVPVFLWGRRIAGLGPGLAAAILSVLPPALAYSGLIMSEAAYYPAVAVALLLLARAVEHPTLFRLGVMLAAATFAAAIRLQALVLLPVFLTALLLDAVVARDSPLLRRRAALMIGASVAGAACLAAWLATGRHLSSSALLGAYGAVGGERPGPFAVARELVWSTGGLVLVSCAIPLLATAVLASLAFAEGEPDPAVRAFVATTVAYLAWLVLQVAVFAASFVGYVPERYLVTAMPLAFLGLCTWVARGAPRPWRVLVPVAAAAVALVAAISPGRFFADVGAHDLLTTLAFRGVAGDAPEVVVRAALVGTVLAGAAVVALVPRRRAGLAVVAAAAALATVSAGSAREIARHSQQEEAKAFGTADRDWIEDAAPGQRVALLNTGDREWPIVPRTQFWNANVVDVVRLPDAPGSGAIPQKVVEAGADGVLRTGDGRPLEEPFVAAPAGVALAGEKVAEIAPTSVAAGTVLWRVSPPARLETSVAGLGANGDFAGSVYVTVYACGPGRLELTLLGKSGAPIAIRANGIPRLVVQPPPGGLWQGGVRTPPGADGRSTCVYELSPSGPAGSTRIAFARDR